MMRRSINGESTLRVTLVLLAVVFLFCSATYAQERLRITINDTVAAPGDQAVVEVFLTNPLDDIWGFQLHIVLNRSDIANFHTNLETVETITYWFCQNYEGEACTDSVQVYDRWTEKWNMTHTETYDSYVTLIDTVGTLISGWDLVTSRSVSTGELGLDILITAIANTSTPGEVPPLLPQGGGVLFRIPITLQSALPPIPDDRTAGVFVETGFKRWFGFATPIPGTNLFESIGWILEPMPDTNFYMCVNPEPPPGNGCYEWMEVFEWECPEGECDSTAIVMVDVAVLDETQVNLIPGSITMVETTPWICGDLNGDGNITIGDISILIDHLFISNTPIDPIEAGNVNCSTEQPVVLTIGDISALIDRLFITRTPLCCEEQGGIE